MAETMTPVNLAAFDLSNDTDRLVLADLLAENDRKQEESLCRETATRLAVDDGWVIRALRLEVIAFLKEVGEPHGVVVDPVTHDPAVAARVRSHYLPIAHARPDAAKRRALEALRRGWQENNDHGKIRHWGRAAINIAVYCLLPSAGATLEPEHLESATDAVVRFSGWRHTDSNLWRRFKRDARVVVRELWSDIEPW
jgi:hypothetical protein